MKCLTPEQLLELIYGETTAEAVSSHRQHLTHCNRCSKEYWNLLDIHRWVHQQDGQEPAPTPIILNPGRTVLQRLTGIAAALTLSVALAAGMAQFLRLNRHVEVLQTRNQALDQQLQQAQFRMDQSHRDQYMLMMALKDYMDQNMVERRVSYVPRP